jgi:GNAT superfamily N-acetyltransferase
MTIMSLDLRPAVPGDAAACVALRGLTRENAVPADRLAAMGITPESWAEGIASGRLPGHIGLAPDGTLAGYAFGDVVTGEVVVLALLPACEGQGVGRALLARVVQDLRAAGHTRLFLGCARDPSTRSHGFYRHLGWQPTGEIDANDDEILELWPCPA